MNVMNDWKKMMNKKQDIRMEADEGNEEVKLYIYGPIGGWVFSENSAQSVRRKLQGVTADTIHVHINSPGGSAFDGVAIMNQLKNHKAKIVVHIDGWAASAASVIAMAGDEVIMPENTIMMIHRAATIEIGNAADFEKTAKDLRKIDTALAASYKKRFVGDEAELDRVLDEETFLTADEALALGLADRVTDEVEIPDLEDVDDDEEEPENFKEDIVAKYKKQNQEPENQEPTPTPDPKNRNMSKLFLNLNKRGE